MPLRESRFRAAIERFDAANARDPNLTIVAGVPRPKELVYAQRMTEWLDRLAPDASEPVRLAARSQHLMRWSIPRSAYPMDRPGYLKWRTTLYDFHAEKAAEILRDVGYDDTTIARVQSLVRKQGIKSDPEMQLLEDVICLVFLENYFAEFAADHDEEKLIRILRRTWAKMSPRGHQAALGLDLPQRERNLIEKALL
ncbi:MAG TPA: DUF4202 domain-containing protein [Tepidisphaeraceae bacterium]|nr:DUF4202 domain-containing protein [Tepidisphaeraceae bacterium]